MSKVRIEAKRRVRRKSEVKRKLKAVAGLVVVFLCLLLLLAALVPSFWHSVVVLIVALGLVLAPEAFDIHAKACRHRGEP